MKKGFTLIEIVVVIALIGILSITSYISFGKINEASVKNDYNHKVESFIAAAEVCIDNNEELRSKVYSDKESINISLNELAKDGFIEYNIVNPLSGKSFNYNSFINAYYEDELKYEFNVVE